MCYCSVMTSMTPAPQTQDVVWSGVGSLVGLEGLRMPFFPGNFAFTYWNADIAAFYTESSLFSSLP